MINEWNAASLDSKQMPNNKNWILGLKKNENLVETPTFRITRIQQKPSGIVCVYISLSSPRRWVHTPTVTAMQLVGVVLVVVTKVC